MQEAHRELLRSVKDKPVGTEAGAVYTPDMRLIGRTIGGAYTVDLPPHSGPHIFMHSHPSGLTFSESDIRDFINNFDMELLTAVGNNGKVYVLQKTGGYLAADFVKAYIREAQYLAQARDPTEYAEIMERFLKGADQYGIKFITGG